MFSNTGFQVQQHVVREARLEIQNVTELKHTYKIVFGHTGCLNTASESKFNTLTSKHQ